MLQLFPAEERSTTCFLLSPVHFFIQASHCIRGTGFYWRFVSGYRVFQITAAMNSSAGSGQGGRPGRREGDDNLEDNAWSNFNWGAAAATLVGGVYLFSQALRKAQLEAHTENSDSDDVEDIPRRSIDMDTTSQSVSARAVPLIPQVSNLNSLLADIYVRYIAIKTEDFEYHYKVFKQVIYPLHEYMKKVDPYYGRYSSGFQFAGSHFDGLRIKKPDEFDMDVVIGVPVSLRENPLNPGDSDIIIEPKHAGFVQLRAGDQYRNIWFRDGADSAINGQACKWLDTKNYILRSKFIKWFQGVLDRALNEFANSNGCPSIDIDGIVYTIGKSSSGPACTLIIRNSTTGFRLDVDLVPALKFPESRWLGRNKTYRDIPAGCNTGYWMVVPKCNMQGATSQDGERSWRIAMHNQEKKLIRNTYHLRQANRLLKKLRDTQGMSYIASYYIKTLFLWKFVELDKSFWQRDVATIFKMMLRELYNALLEKTISNFWNRKNNLLAGVPEHILKGYANKVQKLLFQLENTTDYMSAAKFLLTTSELSEYERLLKLA